MTLFNINNMTPSKTWIREWEICQKTWWNWNSSTNEWCFKKRETMIRIEMLCVRWMILISTYSLLRFIHIISRYDETYEFILEYPELKSVNWWTQTKIHWKSDHQFLIMILDTLQHSKWAIFGWIGESHLLAFCNWNASHIIASS